MSPHWRLYMLKFDILYYMVTSLRNTKWFKLISLLILGRLFYDTEGTDIIILPHGQLKGTTYLKAIFLKKLKSINCRWFYIVPDIAQKKKNQKRQIHAFRACPRNGGFSFYVNPLSLRQKLTVHRQHRAH